MTLAMSDTLSDFEALQKFRAMSPEERMESLFMGTRESVRESKIANARLDTLNGTTKTTAAALDRHLEEHGDQQAGIDFLKLWGGRGTGLIILAIAIATAIVTLAERFR